MTFISVIIPVYNREKHLKQCLDSVINQTFKDIEIICIDDGSTDNSLNILKEYAQNNKNIVILTQQNQGPSVARNLGIRNAKGDYIIFVDSDDWIDLDACKILYDAVKEKDTDILLFSYYNCTGNDLNQDKRLIDFSHHVGDKTTSVLYSPEELFKTHYTVCGKVYKRNFIEKNGLKFPDKIRCAEDRVFYVSALLVADRIGAINLPLYYYRMDTDISLSKNSINALPHVYNANQMVKDFILNSNRLKNPLNFYKSFLELSYISIILYNWKLMYNNFSKKDNLKYLYKVKKEYNCFPKKIRKNLQGYKNLNRTIKEFNQSYYKKFFEPFFEVELRRNRFVLYLFERQILNFSTRRLNSIIYNIRYFMHLLRLRFIAKSRKIRIGFWLTENQKWSSFASLYEALEKNVNFEPYVMVTFLYNNRADVSNMDYVKQNIDFLEKNNIKYHLAYDIKYNRHIPLKEFEPDIVVYQQPWAINENHSIWNTSKHALTCYVPYCYYSLNSSINYLYGFHGCLWKYFVETDMHKKDYENKHNAKNCVALGSPKLDSYRRLELKKDSDKKTRKKIIYAPHHTFEFEYQYQMATFRENGKLILEYAKAHPEFDWVFRPHPVFFDRIIRFNIMSIEEIEQYYKDWDNIGTISSTGDYYELFADSDGLITDCISFLAEYLPTGKPIIHLRKAEQYADFNSLLKIITNSYYKIYDNESLIKTLDTVFVQDNDYMYEERIENVKHLLIDENISTAEKIVNYFMKELKIKG